MADEEYSDRAKMWRLVFTFACACTLFYFVFPPAILVSFSALIATLIWYGSRGVRPKNPRSCVRCGYVLRDLKGTICPECGMVFLNPEAERERILREREGRAKS